MNIDIVTKVRREILMAVFDEWTVVDALAQQCTEYAFMSHLHNQSIDFNKLVICLKSKVFKVNLWKSRSSQSIQC